MPPSVEYCRVEPAGQDVAGAATTPPLKVQLLHELWLLTIATGAAAVKVGQIATQLMVADAVALQPIGDSVTVTVYVPFAKPVSVDGL